MYLHFPDLDPEATGKPEQLQIGYCYMPSRDLEGAQAHSPARNEGGGAAASASGRGEGRPSLEGGRPVDPPEAEIVRPLRVRNVTDRKLYLTCIPNLRRQCFVCAEPPSPSGDRCRSNLANHVREQAQRSAPESVGRVLTADGECTGGGGSAWPPAGAAAGAGTGMAAARPPVVDLLLLPQSTTTLYIGLRPVLPAEAYVNGCALAFLRGGGSSDVGEGVFVCQMDPWACRGRRPRPVVRVGFLAFVWVEGF